MGKTSTDSLTYKYLWRLELLSVLAFKTYFELNQISRAWEMNAVVINLSGRQRMLSQRTALFSLRLVCSQNTERVGLRSGLLDAIALMEKTHNGLLNGDCSINLSGQPSTVVKAMYFEPPLHLDRQMRNYVAQVRALVQTADDELTPDNPHLRYIVAAASTDLLTAIEAVVSQYQKESDAVQLASNINQAEMYKRSCAATAAAKAQAQQLGKALYDLKQSQAQLIHTEKMSSLGHLLAGVAHEINNPVSFIYGNLTHAHNYTKNLLELVHLYQQHCPNPAPEIQKHIAAIDLDFLIEDLPKMLDSMNVGAERICQIVLSLRNFSRLDQAQMKQVDIHEGIDSTLLILQNQMKAHGKHPGIEVIKEYGDLPLVKCYPGQLNQVFMNIISNAIDALENIPSPLIKIRTEVIGFQAIAVRIADNGIGMNKAVKARLFDSFFTTKPIGKGTGLGLSISHQIVVDKHGGLLRCVSEPGQGTEFWIEIPLQPGCELSASSPMRVGSA